MYLEYYVSKVLLKVGLASNCNILNILVELKLKILPKANATKIKPLKNNLQCCGYLTLCVV